MLFRSQVKQEKHPSQRFLFEDGACIQDEGIYGAVLKQEPLARMFFLFYLCILHLWTFCLVIFHAHSYEHVHGDLGTLSETGGFGTADMLNAHARMSLQP